MLGKTLLGLTQPHLQHFSSEKFLAKNNQQGFTLIEMLVVVAIVGLLANTAVPMYLNYAERSRISEVMAMAKVVKHGITENYMTAGKMLDDPSNASINLSPDQSQYIAAINFSTTVSTATVTYTLGNTRAVGDIAVVGSISGNTFTWRCDTPATTVANKYLPANCHR